MGVLYAMECDLCGKRQVERQPHDLKGRTYNEGGHQKWCCEACDTRLKGAFAVGKKGLRDPLSKVGKLVKQRDKANRERDEALAALKGENPYAHVIVGDPKAAIRGPEGRSVPLAKPPRIGQQKPKKDRRTRWKGKESK
jgi:hypothetical protein